MTRREAEEQILLLLDQIRNIYFTYNPGGDLLSMFCMKDFLSASNDFSYGGKDYDHPVSISRIMKEGKTE